MRLDHGHHLAYCTNIHPAESWEETLGALKAHTLKVRDHVGAAPWHDRPGHDQPDAAPAATSKSSPSNPASGPYAIGLRLSARAAAELLEDGQLPAFQQWLADENCYVFTINGFPYGAFHGTRVKENVYRPDWTTAERLAYTKQLFDIIAALAPEGVEGSVSTLPGSFKAFDADEAAIFAHLDACARHIEDLADQTGKDLHLGLEPEPLGHFENCAETLAFFERFLARSPDPDLLRRRIGINYDTCHFAVEFDECADSLDAFRAAGLRISKVHLSSALGFDPADASALEAVRQFDEPTYLHQVIVNQGGELTRFQDLPDFRQSAPGHHEAVLEGRIHFHIPLYSEPAAPLHSTQSHVRDLLAYRRKHPDFCRHYEIETYTWGVLPGDLQRPIVDQIAEEYRWALAQL
ncbi:MAG: metabolite traffic protein EboE [Akkermansiaceae bacterium]|nr:metabolite traffic protein EboE [Akkermansiaceae bacterium]